MPGVWIMRCTPLSLAAALAAAFAAAGLAVPLATATADVGKAAPLSYVFGVIGDVPYGADQVASFPGWVDRWHRADAAVDAAAYDPLPRPDPRRGRHGPGRGARWPSAGSGW